MEGLDIYDWSRLVFITFIISLIVVAIILLVQRKRNIVNGFTLAILAVTSIIASGINLIILGYIADELGLGGDIISSYMFLIILGLVILNWIIYAKNKDKNISD
ncbi:hypothetical protein F7731_09410 [Cytobacillus depressus]|uniref:Uncharacterized protein n=1 Tax=Cytobacillus depressus TaxID=1602942 RepID=A0A6L3V890_9BACI|nr:hypothetical protein [Cytobacillus depressus]KAB2336575.1 hypothetical protein F7731_09410 [Cytobacillus depressus]